jgi:hypothetical protein
MHRMPLSFLSVRRSSIFFGRPSIACGLQIVPLADFSVIPQIFVSVPVQNAPLDIVNPLGICSQVRAHQTILGEFCDLDFFFGRWSKQKKLKKAEKKTWTWEMKIDLR